MDYMYFKEIDIIIQISIIVLNKQIYV